MTVDERSTAGTHLTPGLRLVVFSSLFPSEAAPGAGTFIRERMFRLPSDAVEMIVVAPVAWSPLDWLIRRFRPGFRPVPVGFETMDGVPVFRPRYFSIPGFLKRLDGRFMAWGCLSTLRRIRVEFRPNLIDGHFLYPDSYAASWLGNKFGVPVTINIRGSKDQRLIGTACEAAMRWTAARAQAVLAVSSRLVQDVALPLGVPPDRVTVIGNGVDLARFRPLDRLSARKRLGLEPEAKVLIGVGNLIELKGFQRVIPLLPGLRQRFPGLQYLIVGGSAQQADMSAQLRSLAERHGVADNVRICGPQPQDELAWFYSAADVFVLATAYEGWANVFLEAIACGLPVVTTRVGGNAEVIANPSVGTLVDYWAPDDFAAAIEQALQRNWDRKVLLEYAAAHSWEVRTQALLKFLVDAAEAGRPQSRAVSRR